MSTLSSAIQGLTPKKKRMEYRMRRVSLGIAVYLIWEEINKRLFDNSFTSVEKIFRRFQVLFFIIFHFHEKDQFSINVDQFMAGLNDVVLVACCFSACFVCCGWLCFELFWSFVFLP